MISRRPRTHRRPRVHPRFFQTTQKPEISRGSPFVTVSPSSKTPVQRHPHHVPASGAGSQHAQATNPPTLLAYETQRGGKKKLTAPENYTRAELAQASLFPRNHLATEGAIRQTRLAWEGPQAVPQPPKEKGIGGPKRRGIRGGFVSREEGDRCASRTKTRPCLSRV